DGGRGLAESNALDSNESLPPDPSWVPPSFPLRRISSRPHPPALPPRKRLRTDCSAAVPVHRRWPPAAPDPPPGCAGPPPSVRRPCPLNSVDSALRVSKKDARF